MINTVIRNFISNAIKFTSNSGKIKIYFVNNNDLKDTITIVISDTGVGMTESTILNVFKIDYSVSTLGTDGETGTGFGLKLCKEFMNKNSGSLSIQSKPNIGTSVFIKLPKYSKNSKLY